MSIGCHLNQVTVEIGKNLFGPFSFDILQGEKVAILGPSGAGKSTLLKLLARDLHVQSGYYIYRDKEISKWSIFDLSRSRAVLPQSGDVAFGLLAELVIGLGRASRSFDPALGQIIESVSKLTRCSHLLGRGFNTLSGGEKARVQLARVFAQLWDCEDGLLLMDEPLASLDPGLQVELLDSMCQYAEERNHTIIAVLHDINQSMNYFQRLLLVKDRKLVGDVMADQDAILDLQNLYDIQLHFFETQDGLSLVFPGKLPVN